MALTDVRRPADTLSLVQTPAPAEVSHVTAAHPRREREAWLDNARLVAAVGVVVGHFLVHIVDRSGLATAAWTATWAFRIPVYVVIAGLFTSSEPLNRERSLTLLRNVFFVYVLFELLMTIQRGFNTGAAVWDPFTPEFGLWFLLSLFCWRIALPIVAHLPHLLLWSVGASVLAGFIPSIGTQFGVSRTVALFPLFVLGWKLRDAGLRDRLGATWVRMTAVVTAAVLGLTIAVLFHEKALDWSDLLMKDVYSGDLEDQVGQAFLRFAVLGAGAVGALAVLSLVPRRRIRFVTYLGAGSMTIYLLHLFVVQQLNESGYFDTVNTRGEMLVMLVLALATAVVLGSAPVRRLVRPLVQPRRLGLPKRVPKAATLRRVR